VPSLKCTRRDGGPKASQGQGESPPRSAQPRTGVANPVRSFLLALFCTFCVGEIERERERERGELGEDELRDGGEGARGESRG